MKKLRPENKCKHRPERLFSWMAQGYLCAGCCDCGKTWEKIFPKKYEREVKE